MAKKFKKAQSVHTLLAAVSVEKKTTPTAWAVVSEDGKKVLIAMNFSVGKKTEVRSSWGAIWLNPITRRFLTPKEASAEAEKYGGIVVDADSWEQSAEEIMSAYAARKADDASARKVAEFEKAVEASSTVYIRSSTKRYLWVSRAYSGAVALGPALLAIPFSLEKAKEFVSSPPSDFDAGYLPLQVVPSELHRQAESAEAGDSPITAMGGDDPYAS